MEGDIDKQIEQWRAALAKDKTLVSSMEFAKWTLANIHLLIGDKETAASRTERGGENDQGQVS
jgi:hypothetical protein